MDPRPYVTGHALGSREMAILLSVSEQGSLRRAAAQIGISPAAVSQAVRRIEARLGSPVFSRASTGVQLTEPGRRLIEQGRDMLAALARAEDDFRVAGRTLSGLVRIGSGPIPAPDIARIVVPEAKRRWPALRLSVELGLAPELVSQVARGKLDFAVCHTDDYALPPGLSAVRVQHLEAVLLVRAGHALANRGRIAPARLAPFAICSVQPSTRFPRWFATVSGAEPEYGLIASDFDMLADAAAQSDMLLFVARHQAAEIMRRHALVLVDIDAPPYEHHVSCIAPKSPPSAAARAVIGLLQDMLGGLQA